MIHLFDQQEPHQNNDQKRLTATKRKYSHWQVDEAQDLLSVAKEESIDKNKRLSSAKRNFSQWYVGDHESYYSILSNLEEDFSVPFCNETISLYDPWLRSAYDFTCICVLFLMFVVSYMFFFKSSKTIWDSLVPLDVLYAYIMFLRSRTGYMVDGVEERNLAKVRDKYNRSWGFVLDLISQFPLGVVGRFFPGTEKTLYALGRQRQYVRIHILAYYLGIREEEPGSSTVLYRSLRLIILVSLMIHFTACLWFGLACSRFDETFNLKFCSEESWIAHLPRNILEEKSGVSGDAASEESVVSFLYDVYVTSLYWATATTTSTGYGDVPPYTIGEKLFSVFAMTLGVLILFGMTLGGMTSLLTNADSRRSSFFHVFNAFEEEVADLLDGVEEAFCRNLALVAQPVVYLRNQYVQRSGEIASNMCYIHHGILEVLDEEEKHVVATMHAGKLFGQILLVYDLPRIHSIRCKTNCEIFMLDKHDFRQILADYPQAALKFVNAVNKKCQGPESEWPLDPPSFQEFCYFIEKTSSLRFKLISSSLRLETDDSHTFISSNRRKTTVYSTDYEAIGLSRVMLSTKKTARFDSSLVKEVNRDDTRLSSTALATKGELAKIRKQPAAALEGTRMVATSANYQDLKDAVRPHVDHNDFSSWTWKKYLIHKSLINPTGNFYTIWQNYIFYISFACGLYTSYIAAFTASPGEEITYSSADGPWMELLDQVMRFTCNSKQNDVYRTRCQSLSDVNKLASCIATTSNWTVVTGNDPLVVNITVPATYSRSSFEYNFKTALGILNIFIAYLVFDISFYLNIFVHLRAKVSTPTGSLESFKVIFSNYNKWHKLWFDVIAVFPFEVLSGMFNCTPVAFYSNYVLFRLNRTLNFFHNAPSTFMRWENSLDVRIIQIRTIKSIMYIYYVTHSCACVFYSIACGYEAQRALDHIEHKCSVLSWAWFAGISHKTEPFKDYIKTMYWATTTMTSTGYGDILPRTNEDRVIALSTMIIGTIAYGWLVAVIAATLSNAGAAAASFGNSMVITKSFLAEHNVQKPLIQRVMNVRRIEWSAYKGTATPGKRDFGGDLPEHLRLMMVYESVGTLLENLPFWNASDSSFIAFLCNYVQMFFYAEGDVIIYEGDLSRNLYIIKKGHCNVVTEDLTEAVDHLYCGDYFGEMETFFGVGSPCTIVAMTACEMVILQKSDLDEVLQSFPVLKEQMSRIENDDDYKQKVLDAVKLRNEPNGLGLSMTKCYTILEMENGLKYYGMKNKCLPACFDCTEACTLPLEEKNIFLRMFVLIMLPFTLNPQSHAYIAYESMRVVLILLTAFIVPLQFAMTPFHMNLLVLQHTLDVLSIFDQYIRAHVMYYNEEGVLVTQPSHIAKNYLKTGFTLDFFSWLPVDVITFLLLKPPLNIPQWRLIAVLRLNRLMQLNKVFSYFAFWLSDIRNTRHCVKYFGSFIAGLVLHHLFACLLFLTACPPTIVNSSQLHIDDPDMILFQSASIPFYCHKSSWLGRIIKAKQFSALDLEHSAMDQYVISFYWAAVTLVCTGYGDVHAVLSHEMLMATVAQVVGTIFYSVLLGDSSARLQNDDMRRGHFQGRISDVKKFFDVYYVTEEVKQQVINSYHYLWNRTQGLTPDDLLIGLPPSLHASACQSMYEPMLKEAFVGKDTKLDKEAKGFFRLLSTYVHPYFFLKGNIVCRRGDIGDEMFFIQRGNVAILEEDDKTIERVLEPGQHFGEIALVPALPRTRTLKALTNCDMNVLRKKDLDCILNKFPRIYYFLSGFAEKHEVLDNSVAYLGEKPVEDAAICNGAIRYTNVSQHGIADKQSCGKVFKHNSKFIYCWSAINIVVSALSVQLILYQSCFFNHSMVLYALGYLTDIWCLADMIISFHKTYVDQFGATVDIISVIHTAYMRNYKLFVFDLVTNAPMELFIHAFSLNPTVKISNMPYMRLNRLPRAMRVLQLFNILEEDITLNVVVFRTWKCILNVVLTASSVSCVWYIISCTKGHCRLDGWTNLPTTSYRSKKVYSINLLPYVDGLYWAVATMTSTGYGDIKPETQIEMIFACFVTVMGKILISHRLGHVAVTIANNESLRVWYEHRVTSAKHYMVDLQFDKKLFDHVVQYYDYMWMKNHGVNVMSMFPDLPFSLRSDVYSQLCREMIDNLQLFKGCSESFLRHLCMVVEPASFMPGDFICLQGDIRSEMFIIFRGVAEATKNVNGKQAFLRMVIEGDSFLCESVLCKVRRPCSLRACTYVDVFSMSMEGLQKILEYHPLTSSIVFHNARLLYPDLHL